MKKVLLDYDNTICDFTRMFVNKWNSLGGEFSKHKLNYDDVSEYSLLNFLMKEGYSKDKSMELLNKFWKVNNLYQDGYVDAPHRNNVMALLKKLKKEDDVYIELNSICNSFSMSSSKLGRIKRDDELISLLNNIVIHTSTTEWKPEKPYNYDIVIEDEPTYILKYLGKNKSGKVYMPVWSYNEHLTANKRIIPIYADTTDLPINTLKQLRDKDNREL